MGRAIIFLHKICSIVLFKKKTLAQEFFCEFCKIFKNSFFTENLWMTPSILPQLLTLSFAIIHSWQLSSSEKSLVEKKNVHISQGFYRFRDLDFYFLFFHCFLFLFHFIIFICLFIYFDNFLFILPITQSVSCTLSSQSFCWPIVLSFCWVT